MSEFLLESCYVMHILLILVVYNWILQKYNCLTLKLKKSPLFKFIKMKMF